MTVLGNKKQEEKIQEMGVIAHNLAHSVSVMSFKGAFRMGIKQALEKSGNADWKDLARKSKPEKRQFFNEILEASRSHLENSGLSGAIVGKIFNALKKKNDEYLEGS